MSQSPRVSVVLPAYLSEKTVERSLEGLAGQTFRDFEVIVVDSSPDGATEAIVRSRFPSVRYERAPERLAPHAARNRGAERARGRLIAFTDSDCRARPDWLARLVAAHDRGHLIVGGAVEPAQAGLVVQAIHLCKFGPWLSGGAPGVREMLPTASLLWDRAVWATVGPFRVLGWSGDTELSWRARRAGHPLAFEPAAVVEHEQQGGLMDFWRERLVRGRAFARLRADVEGWSRRRAAAHLVAVPYVVGSLTAQGLRQSARSGGPARALISLPVLLAGYSAWAVGEGRAHLDLLRGSDPLD
jgi:glycosyltransferase involved in cell wall biosynthesis